MKVAKFSALRTDRLNPPANIPGILRDVRLPQPSRWELRSSGLLGSE